MQEDPLIAQLLEQDDISEWWSATEDEQFGGARPGASPSRTSGPRPHEVGAAPEHLQRLRYDIRRIETQNIEPPNVEPGDGGYRRSSASTGGEGGGGSGAPLGNDPQGVRVGRGRAPRLPHRARRATAAATGARSRGTASRRGRRRRWRRTRRSTSSPREQRGGEGPKRQSIHDLPPDAADGGVRVQDARGGAHEEADGARQGRRQAEIEDADGLDFAGTAAAMALAGVARGGSQHVAAARRGSAAAASAARRAAARRAARGGEAAKADGRQGGGGGGRREEAEARSRRSRPSRRRGRAAVGDGRRPRPVETTQVLALGHACPMPDDIPPVSALHLMTVCVCA